MGYQEFPPKEGQDNLFRGGRTIKDLIATRSVQSDTLETIVPEVLDSWHNRVLPKLRNELSKPLPSLEIAKEFGGIETPPYRKVDLGNATVYLVGVTHSGRNHKPKNTDYGARIKNFVDHTHQQYGFTWATEQNLDRDFDIRDHAIDVKDQGHYFDLILASKTGSPDKQKGRRGFIKKLGDTVTVIKSVVQDRQAIVNALTYLQSDDLIEVHGPVMTQLDQGNILLAQRLVEMSKLPEPLDIEASLVLSNGNDLHKPSISVDRSYIQARRIEDIVRKLSSDKSAGDTTAPESINVGFLIGHVHTTQVEYFLKNPAYKPHESLAEAASLLQR